MNKKVIIISCGILAMGLWAIGTKLLKETLK